MSPKSKKEIYNFSRPSLPVDRGWAWMITLGAFINSLLSFSFIRSLSIFFLEFLDRFQQSTTMTTLSFGLNTAAFSICAILVPPCLLTRFSARSIALVGALLNAGSIIGLAFSPNMICINIMFIVLGLSHPLMFISQVTLLGVYFKKRLSFAVACANLGLSLAMICGPPLTQLLLNAYGLTGALLIHGGLNLNNIAACLLFRSPELYSVSTHEHLGNDLSTSGAESICKLQTSIESLQSKAEIGGINSDKSKSTNNAANDEGHDLLLEQRAQNSSFILSHPRLKCLKETDTARSKSLKSLNDNMSENPNNSITNGKTYYLSYSERNLARLKNSFTDLFTSISKLNFIDKISSSKSLKYLSDSSLCLNEIIFSLSKVEKVSHNDTADSSVLLHTPTIITVEEVEITPSGVSADPNFEDTILPSTNKTKLEQRKLMYCHPLKILLLLIAGFGVNTQCAAAYMPSLGKENGLVRDQLPLLMTVIGTCDLFKIVIGYLADKGWVRRINIVCVCQLIMGVTFQFASFFHGFVSMIILCIIFGANTGSLHILLPGITTDLVGAEFIGQIMSGYFLINGIVMSLTHILIGSLKDKTGSFVGGYNFIGGLILFSVVLILMEPVIKSCLPEEKMKENAEKTHSKCCQNSIE